MALAGVRTLLSLAVLVAAGAGCSKVIRIDPVPNERKGLLDRLAGLRPAGMGLRPDAPVEELSEAELASARKSANGWIWPLKKVQVTSEFGKRDGRYHEGVDLRASMKTPVYAVADGEVAHAGRLSGYGRMVVIRHPGGLFSLYAHLDETQVRKGDKVKQGQKIALSGNTGRSSGPHLHFEVRRGVAAVDPLRVLPSKGTVALFR